MSLYSCPPPRGQALAVGPHPYTKGKSSGVWEWGSESQRSLNRTSEVLPCERPMTVGSTPIVPPVAPTLLLKPRRQNHKHQPDHHTMVRPPYGSRKSGNTSKINCGRHYVQNPELKLELHCHRVICPPGVPPVSRVSMQESIPIFIELKHFWPLWVTIPADLYSRI